MSLPALLGAVLAGGESRRFGRDKATEVVAGVPLVSRAAATLADVFPHVVVVSSRAHHDAGWPRVPDLRPGLGPLAGVEAALEHAASLGLVGAFVLACDLPLVDADTIRSIARALGPAAAAAPERDGTPPIEPLCAAYRVSCLPAVREALDRGRLAAHGPFAAVDGVTVRLASEQFLNVNRPDDLDRAEQALADRIA